MRKLLLLILATLSPALAACQGSVISEPGFGDAVNHNVAMQVINPDPHPGQEPAPEASGRRAADAMERYQSGKVIQPKPLNTSDIKASEGN
ncbi:MAG: hypothetical protein H3C38_09655 [Rhodospirillales bacterium]|nr:hypothetical protein [Rhodospirillales bacterium]